MTRHFRPIDQRPFQSKAKLEQQAALVARYGAIALPELADAIRPVRSEPAPAPVTDGVAEAA